MTLKSYQEYEKSLVKNKFRDGIAGVNWTDLDSVHCKVQDIRRDLDVIHQEIVNARNLFAMLEDIDEDVANIMESLENIRSKA